MPSCLNIVRPDRKFCDVCCSARLSAKARDGSIHEQTCERCGRKFNPTYRAPRSGKSKSRTCRECRNLKGYYTWRRQYATR